MEEKFKIGDVVLSKMGRDSGRHYIVVATEDNFVYICDGDLHKSDKPKKKKNKHVKAVGKRSNYIEAKLSEEGKVTNTELRRAIAEFEEEIDA
ncbi:MAG: RNA-binding protein [Clostridia bacterium]|nr:RNA-binding protein [Clostridia bacterium]